jgi:alkylmercury lyase
MAKTIGNNRAKTANDSEQAIDKILADIYESLGSERRHIVGQVWQLLANGYPVPPDEVAVRLRISSDSVTAALEEIGAEFDKEGNIVGFGLTLVPTRHVYEVDGRKLYTWCAADALGFPVVLKQNANIESPDLVTGEKIRISVTPDRVEKIDPKSAVVSWVKNIDVKNIRGSGCNNCNFFSSQETATIWIADHPDQTIYPVNDIYKTLKKIYLHKHQDIMAACKIC